MTGVLRQGQLFGRIVSVRRDLKQAEEGHIPSSGFYKDLLRNTGSSAQYSVITRMGKEFVKE